MILALDIWVDTGKSAARADFYAKFVRENDEELTKTHYLFFLTIKIFGLEIQKYFNAYLKVDKEGTN